MPEGRTAGDLQPGVLTEYLTEETGFFVRSLREYERFQSPYQTVEVHDTAPFGKLFRLDGHFMTSEKDEFFYHENLVHIAAIAHPSPETALVVGGSYRPRVTRGLLTGLHEAGGSHFRLLQAFAPRELLERAYAHAEANGYLCHEFGDSNLIL